MQFPPEKISITFFSADTVFQQEGQEGILNSAHSQESLKIQEAFLRPIHPPVIVDLSHDEDDEEEDEEEDEDNKNSKQVFFFFYQGSRVDIFHLLQCSSQLIYSHSH